MSETVTSSERYLAVLARRAFLRLWSYPNPFAKKGKELCDLLFVFGDDVVIFSDKDCFLNSSKAVALAWRRWYSRAVLESASQVAGAERALLRGLVPYLDATSERLIEVPIPQKPRVHRVLTVRGAADAARSEWGGRGSLIVTNRPLDSCLEAPFRVGTTDVSGRFFHVFDQNALDAVLGTLDTAKDLLEYLSKREALLSRPKQVTASSEEDVLGFFMMSFDPATNQHDFPDDPASSLAIDNSHWEAWASSEQRAARDQANVVSYLWDELVDKFSFHILGGTLESPLLSSVADQEPLARWLASLSRFKRRILSSTLVDMLQTTNRGQIRRRYLPATATDEPFWVFVVLPKPDEVTYEAYRQARRGLLAQHVYVVKFLHPEALDIVAVALGDSDGEMTEDAMVADCRDWSQEFVEEGRRLNEGGIFRSPTQSRRTEYNYPV